MQLSAVLSLALCLAGVGHGLQTSPRQVAGYEKFVQRSGQSSTQSKILFQNASQQDDAINNLIVSSSSSSSQKEPAGDEDADADSTYPDIIESNLTQPIDHFGHGANGAKFQQRYWYHLRYYKPPSQRPANTTVPIFVLDSGESVGTPRLPYLDHGIIDILANATGGIPVVLEHRYYGSSLPNRSDFGPGDIWTTDEMRWLNNKQALEDSAQFVQKMKFDGVDEDLTAPNTPVIYYGGSYAGARAAHMRVVYPELIYGSIASSGVVGAIEEFPYLYYPTFAGAQVDCSQAMAYGVEWMDKILAPEPHKGRNQPKRDASKTKQLQALFGLEGLKDPADFANIVSYPIGSYQSLNWDPSVSTTVFPEFCTALVDHPSGSVDPAPQRRAFAASDNNTLNAPQVVLNWAKYLKETVVDPCTEDGTSVSDCFSTQETLNEYKNTTSLSDDFSWTFQYCTTWGFFQTAPPTPEPAAAPIDFTLSGPKVLSALIDLDYVSEVCHKGFTEGAHFKMPLHPNTTEVNRLGNFTIDMDRLAFINGQYDPWRPATTHSEQFAYGGARVDSLLRPFKLIPNCWHHCDENGNSTYEAQVPRIAKVHAETVEFVQSWLGDFKAE